MRHIDDPLRCMHFALGLLMFVRWMDHSIPVFKPEAAAAAGGAVEEGVERRVWYEEFLIPGYDKGSPGKKVSTNPPPPPPCLWCARALSLSVFFSAH